MIIRNQLHPGLINNLLVTRFNTEIICYHQHLFFICGYTGGGWVYHSFIYLFICWSNRMAAFTTILLLYAPPKVTSVLVLIVIFGGLFINLLLYRSSFVGFSCYFGGLSYCLHFSLLPLLQNAHSQRLGGSWLGAWAYSPIAFCILLGLFGSPLLWIGTTCT